MEGTIIQMSCRVSYIGNMSPVVTWFPGGTIQKESSMIQESSINASTGTIKNSFYNISIRLNSSDNGSVFGFKCHFVPQIADENPQVVKAKNIPDYVFRWNFTAVVYCELLSSLIINFNSGHYFKKYMCKIRCEAAFDWTYLLININLKN